MNTVNIDGQVFDLVPRATIIEEQQQTFTPHDVNSEIPYRAEDTTPVAKNVADVNNVLPRFKEVLEQQNIKGLNKYGTSLDESNVSLLELNDHTLQELTDGVQYNDRERVLLQKVIDLLEQDEPQINEALILLRGE